ncbi:MAG: permease-like cell division protein FtsX [Pseudohongiella sp.]|nr:permease-like cell division protein FtsX [Pseudohongiella sp.]
MDSGVKNSARPGPDRPNPSRPNPSRPGPSRPGGAKRGRSLGQKLKGLLGLHRDGAVDSLRRMRAQPLNTIMSLMVVAIALLLPALLYVGGKNMAQFGESLADTNRINFYLQTDISPTQIELLQTSMRDNTLVERVEFISANQAAADFAIWSGLGNIVESLDNNPLPASLVIHPVDTRADTAVQIRDAFANEDGVRQVTLDQAWVERLESLLQLVDRIVLALILVLSMAVLFITGNAIRTHIASREAEIRVMSLIGATRAFIARPFLYSGAWQGLLGAALAWIFVQLLLLLFRGPAQTLLAFYGEQYQFIGLDMRASLILLAGGLALGWAGAWLSVSRHMNRWH